MDGQVVSLLEAINERLGTIAQTLTVSLPVAISPQQAYTRTQAARLIGVSVWSIDKGRKEGSLVEARRIGKRDVRVTGVSLLRFMKERETTTVIVRKL